MHATRPSESRRPVVAIRLAEFISLLSNRQHKVLGNLHVHAHKPTEINTRVSLLPARRSKRKPFCDTSFQDQLSFRRYTCSLCPEERERETVDREDERRGKKNKARSEERSKCMRAPRTDEQEMVSSRQGVWDLFDFCGIKVSETSPTAIMYRLLFIHLKLPIGRILFLFLPVHLPVV
jgi:CDGSH-type Zn-finger protein